MKCKLGTIGNLTFIIYSSLQTVELGFLPRLGFIRDDNELVLIDLNLSSLRYVTHADFKLV